MEMNLRSISRLRVDGRSAWQDGLIPENRWLARTVPKTTGGLCKRYNHRTTSEEMSTLRGLAEKLASFLRERFSLD
jgi:hypothetical protein